MTSRKYGQTGQSTGLYSGSLVDPGCSACADLPGVSLFGIQKKTTSVLLFHLYCSLMYSEMIIEFASGDEEGEIFLSGRACSLWLGADQGEIQSTIKRKNIFLREPSSWERELLPRDLARPQFSLGAPLLGEKSTAWFWSEDYPGIVQVETDEESERKRLVLCPWAREITRCYRPDALTSTFLIPSALLSFA